MVFGWGKNKDKKQIDENFSQQQIILTDIPKTIQKILELKLSTTLSSIKQLRDNTDPLIKDLIAIGNTMEKDDLKVDDIDRHLRIIVVRGKQQVIDMIKKDATSLPDIKSYDDAVNLNFIMNQMLKKIGDVLGRQTRVIHIFAKKYAEKLKDILQQMNANLGEIQQLITNYNDDDSKHNDILKFLSEMDTLDDTLKKKEQRIIELNSLVESLDKKINSLEESKNEIKMSHEYKKYLELKKTLDEYDLKKTQIKNDIDSQFAKISRPVSKYEYGSSLDKEQRLLLSKLTTDPFDVMYPKHKDEIIMILENVRRGILSGFISVKDSEKSFSQLTETEEALDGFIKQVSDFVEKRQNIQNLLDGLKPYTLSEVARDQEHLLADKDDSLQKIQEFQGEISEIKSRTSELITKIGVNLRSFSNIDYVVVH